METNGKEQKICSCGKEHGAVDLVKMLADMPPEEELYDLPKGIQLAVILQPS